MKKLKKAERLELIRRRAYEYAATGKYSGWHSIEVALRKEGWSEARTVLDSRELRASLDEICRERKGENRG